MGVRVDPENNRVSLKVLKEGNDRVKFTFTKSTKYVKCTEERQNQSTKAQALYWMQPSTNSKILSTCSNFLFNPC